MKCPSNFCRKPEIENKQFFKEKYEFLIYTLSLSDKGFKCSDFNHIFNSINDCHLKLLLSRDADGNHVTSILHCYWLKDIMQRNHVTSILHCYWLKDIMQRKLFQGCTNLLYCSVLSLGGNGNTRRMSKPDMGSFYHIKNQ